MKHTEEHNRKRRKICNRYEKTPKGFLMRLYRNMKSRVSGVQKAKHHLYNHCELLDRDEFYAWAQEQPKFWELYDAYMKRGCPRKLAPSVDRIDSSRGYSVDNMEFVTMSENCKRGTASRIAQYGR